MAQDENEALDRIRQLYKKEDANNGPRYNVSNVKSNIMKKAKIEFLKRFVFVLKDKSRRASGIQFWPWPIGGVFLMNDEDDGITRIMLSADDSDGLCMGPKTTWGLVIPLESLILASSNFALKPWVLLLAPTKLLLAPTSQEQLPLHLASSSSFKKTGSISGIGSTSKDPEPTKRVFWG
ncbi:hypothetical protein JHK87_049554 [Glycine soja]|nr:hypothetical protein JHK87_049554 [Glycine soja]